MASKYTPIRTHLQERGTARIPMSFKEIEALLGFSLPSSARSYRAWWSNNPHNNVMTRAWLDAGYRTEEIDLSGERVVFRSINGEQPAAPAGAQPRGGESRTVSIIAILKGTVTLAPGTDLTEPTSERWEANA